MKEISFCSSYEEICNNDCIYIDKTSILLKLINSISTKKIFFSRPRRFGKSLTLDVVKTIFEKGYDAFKNINSPENLFPQRYPVLYLDFSTFSSDLNDLSIFTKKFALSINKFAKSLNLINYQNDEEPDICLDNLFGALAPDQQIVILIDEYDAQLNRNINKPETFEMYRKILQLIYATFKKPTNSYHIKFLMITGVTRFKDTAIFSVGTDILDFSAHNSIANIVGYSKDEIRENFSDYLKLTTSLMNDCSIDAISNQQIENTLDVLAQNYDGYCFDQDGLVKVFSTWSINNFFQNVKTSHKFELDNYWYGVTSSSSILVEYLKTHSIDEYLTKDSFIVRKEYFLNPTNLKDMNQNVFLYQLGFLTLSKGYNAQSKYISLKIPNEEVKRSFAVFTFLDIYKSSLYEDSYAQQEKNGIDNPDEALVDQLFKELLDQCSIEDLVKSFNAILHSVSNSPYPIQNESGVRDLIYIYCLGANIKVTKENKEYKGISDLIIDSPNNENRYVVEFKYTENKNNVHDLLIEAEDQIINRNYGDVLPLVKNTKRIAMVFCSDPNIREIVEYKDLS